MNKLDNVLCTLTDKYFVLLPRALQSNSAPKIVSHRGIHDNVSVFENTMMAFEKAYSCGVWGIEFDVQWTKDGCPVVIHDDNCRRVFNSDVRINDITACELRELVPFVPTLKEVIERFGGKVHMMIEFKYKNHYVNLLSKVNQHLSKLIACTDYHIISLDIEIFDCICNIPTNSFLLVAEKNTNFLSNLALKRKFGGITGHYVLIDKNIVQRHKNIGQYVGTGFISSRNCLIRELNRGVDWIFTNNAIEMQDIADQLFIKGRK
jgi:glycerophosphoryl diester phosphodiesterase